ncbi:molybdate ABC transporter substrate-binding protein [Limibacillus halophilus]
MRLRKLFLMISVLISGLAQARAEEPVTIFAAASLTDSLQAVAEAYAQEEDGAPLRLSFASSSTLARQIEAGAPADIYFSANGRWMDYLEERGRLKADSRRDALGNRLAIVAPERSPKPPQDINVFTNFPSMLRKGEHLVIGDPQHVPAGIYAKQVLVSLGHWERIEPQTVFAADVRAALALVERGEADLGIVYATDAAMTPRIKRIAIFPENLHAPIVYPVAILAASDNPDAEKVYAFLLSDRARGIFEEFGFDVRF